MLCSYHLYLVPKHLHRPQNEMLYPPVTPSLPPHPRRPWHALICLLCARLCSPDGSVHICRGAPRWGKVEQPYEQMAHTRETAGSGTRTGPEAKSWHNNIPKATRTGSPRRTRDWGEGSPRDSHRFQRLSKNQEGNGDSCLRQDGRYQRLRVC